MALAIIAYGELFTGKTYTAPTLPKNNGIDQIGLHSGYMEIIFGGMLIFITVIVIICESLNSPSVATKLTT